MQTKGHLVIGNLQQTSSYLQDTGTVDTYFVNFIPAITGYTEGLGVVFRAATDNTGACTLEVDGYGPIPLVDSSINPLTASSILTDSVVYCVYINGNFQLIGGSRPPIGNSGVRLDSSLNLGLGRLQSDTGSTQGTLDADSEVLLDGNNFRFVDTSDATITKTAAIEGGSGANLSFLALSRTDAPVTSKASGQYTLRSDTIQNLQSGAVMKPQGVLFNHAWRLNGNVTTDNLEHEYSCNYFRNHISTTGGFAGGNITLGSLGMNTVLASVDFDDSYTGATSGVMSAIATRLKVSNVAGGIAVDKFNHLTINTHLSLNSTNTVGTHTGINIKTLKLSQVTTAFAIDQEGTSDRNRFAGTVEILTPTTPANSAASGNTGTIAWDENYIYIKTASNGWKRVATSTF